MKKKGNMRSNKKPKDSPKVRLSGEKGSAQSQLRNGCIDLHMSTSTKLANKACTLSASHSATC